MNCFTSNVYPRTNERRDRMVYWEYTEGIRRRGLLTPGKCLKKRALPLRDFSALTSGEFTHFHVHIIALYLLDVPLAQVEAVRKRLDVRVTANAGRSVVYTHREHDV